MTALTDQAQRDRIRADTQDTLFVNAGAGSGKTSALVGRIVTLVLRDGVRLANIAAVTFTERAGAELRDRLRAEFEKHWRAGGPRVDRAEEALNDLDSAAIGTLHSFAQRLLSEHAIEAGLPPLVEVADEIGSSIAFDERWSEIQAQLLDDDAMAGSLLIGMALDVQLKHLRSLTLALGRDWDLITERVLQAPPEDVIVPNLNPSAAQARGLLSRRQQCTSENDRLLAKFDELESIVATFDDAADDESRVAQVQRLSQLKAHNIGQKANWSCPIQEVRDDFLDLQTKAEAIVGDLVDRCLRSLTSWLAERVLESAQDRRRQGRLEFHDLLVLARDLLRRNASVRESLSDEYQRILLDEFQDTDPIQIELATRICGGAAATASRWQDICIPPGRLFVVGDAKQSIYRFRRASIATYLEAQSHVGDQVGLSANFRTVGPVLDWVNTVFAHVITPAPEGQPQYAPLAVVRDQEGEGPAVTVLGAEAHEDAPKAADLREREAGDVAAVITRMLDEEWTVFDESEQQWRPVRRSDIAVLVPARTSLPFLEDAFDRAGIIYRAEASSLVYQSEDVRSLLAAARAVADPSDGLSLVTALRSPIFGCGDDDLWQWRHGGGSFSIYSEVDDDQLTAGPVGSALRYLRRLSFDARWHSPSELLAAIVTDRRMYEVAATGPRARDGWRRLRFVIDQARAWSETAHGGLRAYLAWAARQGQEVSRVAEPILPETDVNAVQVMTVHAAKGLEFPVVIMSGMTSVNRAPSGVSILWPASGGYAVRLGRQVQTEDFEEALPIDAQMDEYERRRLLYVAATRARDYLVVSLHRSTKMRQTAAHILAEAGGASAGSAVPFAGTAKPTSPGAQPEVEPPPAWEHWHRRITTARESSRAERVITASGLEGTEPEMALAVQPVPGLAKGPPDLELPPWSKGRYGSAIGRAVHGVLQVVDLATGGGLDEAVDSQAIAEGVVGQEELIRSLAQSALDSEAVKRAARREHWRETYVGTQREDGTILEGYIDLIFREEDGSLVIIDYKTDAMSEAGLASRVAYYRPQMHAYRDALNVATATATQTWLLFLHPETAVEIVV